jgi:hypothetical protein
MPLGLTPSISAGWTVELAEEISSASLRAALRFVGCVSLLMSAFYAVYRRDGRLDEVWQGAFIIIAMAGWAAWAVWVTRAPAAEPL